MTSILEPSGENLPAIWRLKKASDGSVYGPVDAKALQEWANSAQISPTDQIDTGDENWRPAPSIDFLGMIWIVKLPDEEIYGPTTLGTLREFQQENLINEQTLITHAQTKQSLPLAAILVAEEFEKKRALRRPPKDTTKKSTASIAVDMAREQRIRQLEEDVRELRKQNETLTQKNRQLTLQQQESGRIPTSR